MKTRILKKLCALSLSALMLTGAGIAEAVPVISAGLPVYAAEVTPASDFKYEENNNGGITILEYIGSETNVVIPDTIDGKSVTRICVDYESDYYDGEEIDVMVDGAFSYRSYVESVTIPASVEYIDVAAFFHCTGLKSVTLPDSITTISKRMFEGCTSLTSITIPDSVTTIESYAFEGCTSLSVITIPDSVTNIGYDVFYGCDALTILCNPGSYAEEYANTNNITHRFITIGLQCVAMASSNDIIINKTATIRFYASGGTEPYKFSVLYKKTTDQKWTTLADDTSNTSVSFTPKTAGEYIFNVIASDSSGNTASNDLKISAFSSTPASLLKYTANNDNTITITGTSGTMTDIVIPRTIKGKTVTAIGESAFDNNRKLTSVVLPGTVKNIAKCAFRWCDHLVSVNIPDSITSIGESAFYHCSSLTSLTFPKTTVIIGSYAFDDCSSLQELNIPNSLNYITNQNGDITITKYNGTNTNVVIPSSVNGKKVTEIGSCAFISNDSIISVTISEGVSKINYRSFYNCDSLASVTIPDGVTYIGEDAFSSCEALSTVTIPDSVKDIEQFAFNYCKKLSSVKLPKGLKVIKPGVFMDCESLKEINIPNSVTKIDGTIFFDEDDFMEDVDEERFYSYEGAFSGCKSLKSITLPDSVTEIGSAAFAKSGLTSIAIPSSVKSIKEYAFWNCSNLTISGMSGSYAETYAKNNNIKFKSTSSPLKNTSKVISKNITLGKSTAVLFGASGGTKPYRYSVLYRKSNATKWTTLIANTTKTSVAFTPKAAATYTLKIVAKDSAGNSASKRIDVTVIKPLENLSKVTASKISLGSSTTVKFSASGGTKPYRYSVLYKKSTATKWTTLIANTTKTSVAFKPKAAATYTLKIVAKDSAGNSASKKINVTVTKPLKNTSKLSVSTAKVGQKIKVRCFAEGGTGKYQYAVSYKKTSGNKFYKLAGYSTKNIILFTPKAAATYEFRVTVKDSSGKTASKTLMLKVTK